MVTMILFVILLCVSVARFIVLRRAMAFRVVGILKLLIVIFVEQS